MCPIQRNSIVELFAYFLTILQCSGSHLGGRWPSACTVTGLDHNAILGELLEIVQYQALCVVTRCLDANYAELVVST